ncbi:hypothetical protein GCM10020219_013030 [Nonomuraea dietziae]
MPFIMRNTLPKLAAGTFAAAAVLTAAVMTPAVAASSAPNPGRGIHLERQCERRRVPARDMGGGDQP